MNLAPSLLLEIPFFMVAVLGLAYETASLSLSFSVCLPVCLSVHPPIKNYIGCWTGRKPSLPFERMPSLLIVHMLNCRVSVLYKAVLPLIVGLLFVRALHSAGCSL